MKFLLHKTVYIALTILIFVSSCTTDNPIIPDPPHPGPDTASYYNWTVKVVNGAVFWNIFVVDTNNIWIWNPGGPVIYNGSSFINLYPESSSFTFQNFSVLNSSVSFWIGNNTISDQVSYPSLIKYENGSQQIITLDTINIHTERVLAINENKSFISTDVGGNIYSYDNGLVTKYFLGENIRRPQFFKKNDNTIYAIGFIDSTSALSLINTYKFNGAGFELVRTDQMANTSNPGGLTESFFQCGDEIMNSSSLGSIRLFNGNEWILHSNLEGTFKLGGVSKDSLTAFTSFPFNLYNWNGNKWRLNNNFSNLLSPFSTLENLESNIVNYKGILYFTVAFRTGAFYYSYLIIGKPKQ